MFSLYPHQIQGLQWLQKQESSYIKGGILADDMGVGKTIQIITLILRSSMKKTLIVVPANILSQWNQEIQKFAPSINVIVHWGLSRINTSKLEKLESISKSIVLTSYGLINNSIFSEIEFDRVVCDEAHIFRNIRTKVFKHLDKLKINTRWALTGTPIQNSIKDIITIFKYVGCKMVNKANVDTYIKTKLLRRMKEDINIVLPTINKKTIFIEERSKIDEIIYQKIEDGNFDGECELERLLRLRQSSISTNMVLESLEKKFGIELSKFKTSNYKLKYIFRDIIQNKESNKFIVFTHFNYEIKALSEMLSKSNIRFDKISGNVSITQRNKIIDSDDIDVLLIQINAGGTGINLQKYNYVYFTAPHWNPTIEFQALCRVYRIGQTSNVTIKRIICKQTIESRIVDIQTKKNEIADKHI